LAERDGLTVAASQTGKTRRRTFDSFDAKITVAHAMFLQQLARRYRDRAGLVGETDQFAFEIGDAFNFRSGDQTVNRIIEFSGDRHGIRTVEHRANQKSRRNMRDVGRVVVQRVEYPVRAPGKRHDHMKIQSFTVKKTLAIGNRDGQGENAAHR
jgi:hypothetical protein